MRDGFDADVFVTHTEKSFRVDSRGKNSQAAECSGDAVWPQPALRTGNCGGESVEPGTAKPRMRETRRKIFPAEC
jgi:hypothetical protein